MKVAGLFSPYPWQKEIVNNQRRYNVIVGPRQHGKSTLGTHLLYEIFLNKDIEKPTLLLCADTAQRVYRVYAPYLNHLFGPFGFRWDDKNEKKSTFVLKRPYGDEGVIHVFGADSNYFGPKGQSSDGVLLDEYGLCPRGFLYESIIPSTFHSGGPVYVTGTVEPNHFQSTFEYAKRQMKDPASPWYAFGFAMWDKYSRDVHTAKALRDIQEAYDMHDPLQKKKYQKECLCIWEAGASGTPLAMVLAQARDKGQTGPYPN